MIDSVEDVDRTSWQPEDLGDLLQLVSCDSRVHVREQVAEMAGSLSPNGSIEVACDVLALLCADPSARVRAAAGRGLGRVLASSSPADRIELIGEWATCDSAHRRAAIAHALCASTPAFVTDLAIEQLANDPVADVRAAALEAAAAHFDEAPAVYAAIAERRSDDEDQRVRDAARRLLMRR